MMGATATSDCGSELPRPASWSRHVPRSLVQDALLMSAQVDTISFSLGLPATELFPVGEFGRACAETLTDFPRALQYGQPSEALKSHIVSLMRTRGVACSERQIFLTSGAQQALHLVVALLLDRGQQVIAEDLSYPGFQQIVRFYEPEYLSVNTDLQTGIDAAGVESHLRNGAQPAFIYSIADGHNPVGVSLSQDKRERLVEIARSHRRVIIEEDPYGFLQYSDKLTYPMRALSADSVLYIGSFSKILAPSVRVGWLVVPEHLTPYLAILKETNDIDMATFSQHAVARMLDSGFLPEHLVRLRSEYRRKRDAMLAALARYLPSMCRWNHPECGVYIWVTLPEHTDAMRLLQATMKLRVTFMPGAIFSLSGNSSACCSVRLNFSYPSLQQITEGIKRIGDALQSMSKAPSPEAASCARS